MKEIGEKFYVIEINDNPNIDSGIEDKILKDKLYDTIMDVFLTKLKAQK
jgi:glutathione synthase/RimK-type ligase-like ATP-grasp enzyme